MYPESQANTHDGFYKLHGEKAQPLVGFRPRLGKERGIHWPILSSSCRLYSGRARSKPTQIGFWHPTFGPLQVDFKQQPSTVWSEHLQKKARRHSVIPAAKTSLLSEGSPIQNGCVVGSGRRTLGSAVMAHLLLVFHLNKQRTYTRPTLVH